MPESRATGGLPPPSYNPGLPFLARPAVVSSSPPTSPLALIADDMREVDKVNGQRLDSGVPLVGQVAQYIISAGGKRLRPALLLLISGALNYKGPHRHALAAVVEFI